MAPPSTTRETIAYSISGTSFFLDVVCMIPQSWSKDIELLANLQKIVYLLISSKNI